MVRFHDGNLSHPLRQPGAAAAKPVLSYSAAPCCVGGLSHGHCQEAKQTKGNGAATAGVSPEL